jgi:hypothetical protein
MQLYQSMNTDSSYRTFMFRIVVDSSYLYLWFEHEADSYYTLSLRCPARQLWFW